MKSIKFFNIFDEIFIYQKMGFNILNYKSIGTLEHYSIFSEGLSKSQKSHSKLKEMPEEMVLILARFGF